MQDAVPCCSLYVITVHALIGSSYAISRGQKEKQWWEFFLDPLKWGDHRSENLVTEHQSCPTAHVKDQISEG